LRALSARRHIVGGIRFPDHFVWGAATSAYQIEGAVAEDGRLPSIWDTFSHTPGRVRNGDTGDVAADHYHRTAEDIAIMAGLGLGAYRFSISWSRVIPDGCGAVNQAGVDFYSRLVDDLLAKSITPYVTLYHWDLPQALQDAGGWANRDTAARFADLASVIGSALGDRVNAMTTLNEPWCAAFLGHAAGVHAPGSTDDLLALTAAHHLNLAHGLGVAALRSTLPSTAQLSLTLNLAHVRGALDTDGDVVRHVDALSNRIFLDPVFRGSYPIDLLEDMRDITDWSFVRDADLAVISGPIDVLGVNYYSPTLVTAATPEIIAMATDSWVNDPQSAPGPSRYPGTHLAYAMPQVGPYTAMNWRIDPQSLTQLLMRVHRDYPGIPLMITENGAAFADDVVGGAVHDRDRIDYLSGHLAAVHDAIAQGVDARGYFVWSLLDNFEWAWGFTKRFGIVHIDFDTRQRMLKDSAHWYHGVITANGLPAGG
jgi:beta-glucosidase